MNRCRTFYVVGETVDRQQIWEPWFESLLDLKMLAFAVETAQLLTHQQQVQPPDPLPPRRRFNAKQLRPPAFTSASSTDVAAPETSERVVGKYWAKGRQAAGDGSFCCPLPNCNRQFAQRNPEEGSYEGQVWECLHRPRSFELESGLT